MEDHQAAEELIQYELSAETEQSQLKPAYSKVVCPICGRKINGTANLSFHMALHPVANPFSCDYCVKIFRTKEELSLHVHSDHENDQKFKCNVCGQVLRHDWSLRRHRKIHQPGAEFKCPYCDAEFRGYNAFRLHEVRHTDQTNFKCNLCEVGFYTDEQLSKHQMEGKCTDEIQCCDFVFQKRMEYVDHFLTKHRRNTLEEHRCQYCNKLFAFPSARNYHENKCLNSRGPRFSYSDQSAPESNEHGVYTCEICGMVCNSVSGLKLHYRRLHETQPSTDGKFICFCGKEFQNRTRLNLHKLNVHLKPHACKECGKKFAHRFLLKNHMYSHNQERKPFACQYCDKTFVAKKALSDHENIHTGNRPYKCQYCDSCYKKQSSLFYHMLKHKGQKPYVCKICGAAFSHTSTCRQHEKAHLRNEGKKKFPCKDCSVVFWSMTHLKSHRQTVHEQQEKTAVEETVLEIPLTAQIQFVTQDECDVMPSQIETDEDGNVYFYINP